MSSTYEDENEERPDKPPITDPMPSDEELEQEPEPGVEKVADDEFLDPQVARVDDTVDDEENDEE